MFYESEQSNYGRDSGTFKKKTYGDKPKSSGFHKPGLHKSSYHKPGFQKTGFHRPADRGHGFRNDFVRENVEKPKPLSADFVDRVREKGKLDFEGNIYQADEKIGLIYKYDPKTTKIQRFSLMGEFLDKKLPRELINHLGIEEKIKTEEPNGTIVTYVIGPKDQMPTHVFRFYKLKSDFESKFSAEGLTKFNITTGEQTESVRDRREIERLKAELL
ncbi:MAG: hypothetical protein COT15_01770 [Candidatus Diapherotrites archaeon CG08_land_8_20_14_0_20_34_12]|nr:MAG: hypothetical protein COT15_01770 [Candidatus Diapherotrites archaeon CG08_land_8_20_14_0_20_34_12]